jgi:hypothetical protein
MRLYLGQANEDNGRTGCISLRRIRTGWMKKMQHSCRRLKPGHTYKDNTRTNRMETAQQDRTHEDNSKAGSLGTTLGQDVLENSRTGYLVITAGQGVWENTRTGMYGDNSRKGHLVTTAGKDLQGKTAGKDL